MDPVTAVFVSYLELASQYGTKRLLIDPVGLEAQSVSVEHQGIEIPFSYQHWRIRDNSVCFTYKHNLPQYSDCTVAASSLFRAMCNKIRSQPINHTKQRSIKNMYCNAAYSYKPTIANVQWSEARSEIDVARSECNAAIAGALGSRNTALIQKRDLLCAKYKEMKSR